MTRYSGVLDLIDHGLTQAAMRPFDQFSIRKCGELDFEMREMKHAEHRHMPANLFSYRGLCDPGDLNHQSLN